MPKNGNLQWYVDYRSSNKITVKNKRTLPLIGELINKLFDAAIYTKLDIKNAYYKRWIYSSNK
jgi:hypothetical protein